MGMWKHLSSDQPALYNAIDADAALGCWLGIRKDLHSNGLWKVYDRHIVQVNRVFQYMSQQGVMLDQTLRREAEDKLKVLLAEANTRMQAAVPMAAHRQQVYKKEPKDTTGLIQVTVDANVNVCDRCDCVQPLAAHFKSIGKKRLKAGEVENPCFGARAIPALRSVGRWAKILPWSLSKVGLEAYQKVMGHKPIIDRKKERVTFDEKAILRLQRQYPKDRLYSTILEFRSIQKLLGTYIGITAEDGRIHGGLPADRNSIIHTEFSRNPETLRSASRNPNLQNLPR